MQHRQNKKNTKDQKENNDMEHYPKSVKPKADSLRDNKSDKTPTKQIRKKHGEHTKLPISDVRQLILYTLNLTTWMK